MLRVLIILDEYQELVYMQSLLSKVGFDVETSQSDMALSGLMMGFRPDLIITTAKGRKINGIKLVLDLRKKKPNLKFLLFDIQNKISLSCSKTKSSKPMSIAQLIQRI